MTDESILAFQANKSASIIKSISELFNVSLKAAADMYYQSETSLLIEEGIADLQCRSEKYLATLIWEEYGKQLTDNK